MGQTNLIRTEFMPCEILTSSVDSTLQELAFTSYFKVGDLVDVVAKDSHGCYVGSALAENLTVCGILSCESLTFDASVDTTTALPAGGVGWYAVAKAIDDGQEAIDRLYRCYTKFDTAGNYQICEDIVDSVSAFPSAGQTTLYVNDVNCFLAGDAYQVTCSGTGLAASGSIVEVDEEADEANNMSRIVIDVAVDLSGETGCQICSTDLSIKDIIMRLKQTIDLIDRPVENELIGQGDCDQVAFETDELFLAGSSKLLLDGRRLTLGTAGTRATYVHGAGNAELTYTSMVLGTNGNDVSVEIVSAAGTAVTVTGSFEDGDKLISVNNDSGTATAEEIADAINADSDARKWVQVQFGGDGTGTPAALSATNLAGGLDDGTGDYAELRPIIDNEITLTGYKWVSLWILPDDRNRLKLAPRDSEDIVIDYRRPLHNA